MSDKILVFIPAYNCEKQIVRVLSSFEKPEIANYFSEILVLDNGSKDNTLEAATAAAKKLSIIVNIGKNRDNYNLGGSHKVAFQYARDNGFKFMVVLHGDDQGSITDIIPIIEQGEHNQYDCVLGARFHPQAKLVGYSAFRTFGNNVFNLLFSAVVQRRLYDLGAGLNIYNVATFPATLFNKFPDDLTFNYCMILASCYYKQKIKFFPITWREDDQISNVRLFSQAKKVLRFLLDYGLNSKEFVAAEHRSRVINDYGTNIVASNKG